MEPVPSQLSTTPSHQMLDVVPTIGIIKNVLLALKDLSLILTEFVLLSVISVKLLILKLVLVLHASKAMILSMALALSQLLTMLNLPNSAALNGNGTVKSVFNALKDGFSTTIINVSLLMTSVPLGIPHQVLALHVSAVISSKMDNVL